MIYDIYDWYVVSVYWPALLLRDGSAGLTGDSPALLSGHVPAHGRLGRAVPLTSGGPVAGARAGGPSVGGLCLVTHPLEPGLALLLLHRGALLLLHGLTHLFIDSPESWDLLMKEMFSPLSFHAINKSQSLQNWDCPSLNHYISCWCVISYQ